MYGAAIIPVSILGAERIFKENLVRIAKLLNTKARYLDTVQVIVAAATFPDSNMEMLGTTIRRYLTKVKYLASLNGCFTKRILMVEMVVCLKNLMMQGTIKTILCEGDG